MNKISQRLCSDLMKETINESIENYFSLDGYYELWDWVNSKNLWSNKEFRECFRKQRHNLAAAVCKYLEMIQATDNKGTRMPMPGDGSVDP